MTKKSIKDLTVAGIHSNWCFHGLSSMEAMQQCFELGHRTGIKEAKMTKKKDKIGSLIECHELYSTCEELTAAYLAGVADGKKAERKRIRKNKKKVNK